MKKKEAYRLYVSPPEKRWVLSCLIRCPGLFATFKDELKPEHFGSRYPLFGAVWDVVVRLYKRQKDLPDCDGLKTAVWREVSQAGNRFGNQYEEEVWDFVEQIWDTCDPDEFSDDPESLKREIGSIIKQLREESLVGELSQTVHLDGRVPVDLAKSLTQVREELESLLLIGDQSPVTAFPKGWAKEASVNIFPTNLPFLDCAMEGGHAAGEVNVLLGPMGAGKTTLGIMLAVEGARQGYQITKDSGSQVHELAFFVSYEPPMRELRRRALSYAAQIPRKRLEKMGPAALKSLSTKKTLLVYEKNLFHEAIQAGHVVLGEQERAGRAIEWLNNHLVAFDMSGHDAHHPGAGDGYVAEVARLIKDRLRRQGNKAKPRLIVIDYVGAMARRHLAATNKDERCLRHLVAGAPLQAANLLAHAFDCPVWLLHQLSGVSVGEIRAG